MTKYEYAEKAIKEFKKLGKHITNNELVGNRKLLYLKVYYREKGKINMFDKVMKTAMNFPKLKYAGSNGVGFTTKAGYNYSVSYFLIKSI